MPFSSDYYKHEVKNHILHHIPITSRILDVGPGVGTYSMMLRNYGYKIDCVEVWEPYVNEYNLREKYDTVFVENIMDFDFTGYDYLILGDVLEHLTVEESKNLLATITELGKKCIVAVPYLSEQGEWGGNKYEEHKQPDLTPDVINTRYPNLNILYGNSEYAYYVNYSCLTSIANKHKTDKGTIHYEAHSYTDVYERFISSHDTLNLLEIGVWHGDSIRMWNEYNPNINLYAIDIDNGVRNHLTKNENVFLYIGDQKDQSLLDSLFYSAKHLDAVVDDGSHSYNDIVGTFELIFPKLKPGGVYFIEDLHAGNAEKDRIMTTIMERISKDPENFSIHTAKFFCGGKLLLLIKS
jgi:uncharacterized membrane protein